MSQSDPVPATQPTRQVSIWLNEADAHFLRVLARERNQSLSGVIRSAIAAWRRQRDSDADRQVKTA